MKFKIIDIILPLIALLAVIVVNNDFVPPKSALAGYSYPYPYPVVHSITRGYGYPSPTDFSVVEFDVDFTERVKGVDLSDFRLSTTGVIGASLSEIYPNYDNTSYDVRVNSGLGNGTIRLDLIDDDSISDWQEVDVLGGVGAGNGNYLSGETYIIQKTLPLNDSFVFAKDVATLSYQDTLSTVGATSDPTDPEIPQCNISNGGQATVWYKYEPSTDGAVSIDTRSADYDTFLAIWEGTDINNLRFVACNDDAGDIKQSAVAFRTRGGLTYYIEVGQP